MINPQDNKVTIDHLVDTIGSKEEKNISLAVLMGAGMSVTAGIPLASDIIQDIRQKYPNKVERLKHDEKAAYQKHMKKLFRGERQKLIREYTDPSRVKLNWAHIFLAQLIKEKVVNRVLTVNFDNLLAQALALFGIYPAIYDFAASQFFDSGSVYDPSIFHLHGQMEGFKILNTEEETEEQRESDGFKGLFEDTKTNHALLIIGYSGNSDPVFEKLANQDFSNGLYWIGYKDNPPSNEVREKILNKDDCYLINGYDADLFFDELRNKLGCELPDFVVRPFSHMKDTFYQKIAELEKKDQTTDPLNTSIKWVKQAIETFENKVKTPIEEEESKHDEIVKDSLTQQAMKISLDKDFDRLETFYSTNKEKFNEEGRKFMSFTFNAFGASLASQKKYSEAIEKYREAIKIKPDNAEAYVNWGWTLYLQKKYSEAIEKYQQGIKIKPKFAEAYVNWGYALHGQRKYSEAIEKYQQAIRIRPNFVDAYQNLLEILLDLNKKTQFFKVLKELRSNHSQISLTNENIVLGLKVLAEIQWGQISKESLNQFYKSLTGNNPPANWNFDDLERFYKQINRAEVKKRVRLVLDVWQGKIPQERFLREALTWCPDPK